MTRNLFIYLELAVLFIFWFMVSFDSSLIYNKGSYSYDYYHPTGELLYFTGISSLILAIIMIGLVADIINERVKLKNKIKKLDIKLKYYDK